MQIILTEDVFELGKRGEVIKVADGYGRNYLLPKGLAVLATPGNLKTIEHQRVALAKKEAKYHEEASLLANELSQLHLIFSRKAGESGTLFGSVTAKDICELLKREGISLDRRRLVLDHPIKSIGNYEISARPHSEVEAKLLVSVMIEGDQPINRVKRKDQESDTIVNELNAKIKEMGLTFEGRLAPEDAKEASSTKSEEAEVTGQETASETAASEQGDAAAEAEASAQAEEVADEPETAEA